MTIPAGVTITGWDGQPNTQVSIRKVTMDRSPLPPFPADRVAGSLFMYYFGKVGGGTPSQPVPIVFPNELDLPPGTQVELWYYDEAPDGSRPNAWAQYGTGTVSANGSLIVPDLNPATGTLYGQPRFCCGGVTYALLLQIKQAMDAQRGGESLGKCLACPNPNPDPAPVASGLGGDPVDLATGIFLTQHTDLVLPGRMPIALTRIYRTRGAPAAPSGPGRATPITSSSSGRATSGPSSSPGGRAWPSPSSQMAPSGTAPIPACGGWSSPRLGASPPSGGRTGAPGPSGCRPPARPSSWSSRTALVAASASPGAARPRPS